MLGPERLPRWVAPAATGAVAAAGVVTLAVVDPSEPGHYPTCPFLAVTGLFCPGCGALRAVHALIRGDVLTAIDRNILVVMLLPVLVVAWVGWLRWSVGRRGSRPELPAWAGWTVAVITPIFWIARNLSVGAVLAP